jgi:hypothetical protein
MWGGRPRPRATPWSRPLRRRSNLKQDTTPGIAACIDRYGLVTGYSLTSLPLGLRHYNLKDCA